MTAKSKALGMGLERRVVERARARGLTAACQPGSGVYAAFPNDVTLTAPGTGPLLGECKVRSTPPSLAQLLLWLEAVQANAARVGMVGGFLCFNPKGSRAPKVLLDLDLLLDILHNSVHRVLDTEN